MYRYFYEGQRSHLKLDPSGFYKAVRGSGAVLAESCSNGVAENSPVAVDENNSLLGQGRIYAVYGFQALVQSKLLLGFNGEWRDSLTGCYFLGAGERLYHPILMRFCSVDRLSPFAQGGINSYMYCGGDPVNYTDPSGMSRWKRIVQAKVIPDIRKAKFVSAPDSASASKRRELSGSAEYSESIPRNAIELSSKGAELWDGSLRRLEEYKPHGRTRYGGLTEREKVGGLALDTAQQQGSTRTYMDLAKTLAPDADPKVKASQIRRYVKRVRSKEIQIRNREMEDQILREAGY